MADSNCVSNVRTRAASSPPDAFCSTIAGAGDTGEQHQRLRLTQEAFPAFPKQRLVLGRCRQNFQLLADGKLPRVILLDGERLLQQIACEIGDAEPAAAEHTLDTVAVHDRAVRQRVVGPRRRTQAGVSAHGRHLAATWPAAPLPRCRRKSPATIRENRSRRPSGSSVPDCSALLCHRITISSMQ
jgi:hypothetical protein